MLISKKKKEKRKSPFLTFVEEFSKETLGSDRPERKNRKQDCGRVSTTEQEWYPRGR
jgi:hypothetical protein